MYARNLVEFYVIWRFFSLIAPGLRKSTENLNLQFVQHSPLEIRKKIRCYCNLEECRAQDDSCSFENGGCFSDFLDYRDITQAKHGCLHLLDRKRQEQCRNTPGSSGGPRSLLLCCQSDMCNQVLSPVSLVTHPIIGSLINATESHNVSGRIYDQKYGGNNTNEIWFKAATIAVPICGAMILLMLVALAFKILRTDHVSVEKYRVEANSNANYTNSHIFSFKSNDLDVSKKVPLLYEARKFEIGNSEDFRNFTSTRIHYGQNVNILKDKEEISLSKIEKNLENAKINSEKPRKAEEEPAATTSLAEDTCKVSNCEDAENPRVLATLTLNLDKNDCLNSCNLYNNPRTLGESSSDNVCSDFDKLYEKYWL